MGQHCHGTVGNLGWRVGVGWVGTYFSLPESSVYWGGGGGGSYAYTRVCIIEINLVNYGLEKLSNRCDLMKITHGHDMAFPPGRGGDHSKMDTWNTWNKSFSARRNSPCLDHRATCIYYIIALYCMALIWDTDWLNTVTWLTNISVCCPPQSCGGGTLIDTKKKKKKKITPGNFFTQTKWQNELAILSFKMYMLTALDRALTVSFYDFYGYFMQEPRMAMGSHII